MRKGKNHGVMHHDTHFCHMCEHVLLTQQVVDIYIHTGSDRMDRNRVRKGKDHCVMGYGMHIFHVFASCDMTRTSSRVARPARRSLYTHTGPNRVDGHRARKGTNYGGTNGTNGD